MTAIDGKGILRPLPGQRQGKVGTPAVGSIYGTRPGVRGNQLRALRKRRLLAMTETLLSAMAALASMGLRRRPKKG